MRILFVAGGNTPTAVVDNQAASLQKQGIEVDLFLIKGEGVSGYLKNVFILRNYLKQHSHDLIHAHFSYSGIVVSLASRLPLVVSLMGSDVYTGFFWKLIIKIFHSLCWDAVIVKSKKMAEEIKLPNSHLIPNGVDFEKFRIIDEQEAKNKVGFNHQQHILFIASKPENEVKNLSLAQKAVEQLNQQSVKFCVLSKISNELIPYYLCAADMLLLTSHWEGSPNVIKEAMACNCPIVATDVGDVKEMIQNTKGCFIASFEPEDVAEKIKQALSLGKRTNGRKKIQHLNEKVIAEKIIDIYRMVLSRKSIPPLRKGHFDNRHYPK
jgi:glycosyltransferase involved in cell wall biosynthesis